MTTPELAILIAWGSGTVWGPRDCNSRESDQARQRDSCSLSCSLSLCWHFCDNNLRGLRVAAVVLRTELGHLPPTRSGGFTLTYLHRGENTSGFEWKLFKRRNGYLRLSPSNMRVAWNGARVWLWLFAESKLSRCEQSQALTQLLCSHAASVKREAEDSMGLWDPELSTLGQGGGMLKKFPAQFLRA